MRASMWRYRSLRQFLIIAALMILAGVVLAAAERAAAAAAQTPGTDKPRIAVLNFEFGTVQRWWSGNWDVGRGLSDLVLTSLTRQGQFRVIERRALEALLKEQALSGSGIIDPATGAKIGKVLGVDFVIVGSVTQFGFDDRSYDLSSLSNKSRGGILGNLFKAEAKRSKAVVAVDARLIDVNTAEILAVATGKGESTRSSIGGLGADYRRGATGVDMASSNFQDTVLGEATRRCVDRLTRDLTKTAPKSVAVAKAEYAGKVADVDGGTLILNIGTTQGVRVGDQISIERVVREVKDPDTGRVLREVTETVGTLVVMQVDAVSAAGTFTGAGTPQVGDRARSR